MAIASTFWLENWGTFDRSGSADESVYWNIITSPTHSLYFTDNVLSVLADTTNPTFQSSGNGFLDYLGGSGLSNPSAISDDSILSGLIVEIVRTTTGKDALGRFIQPYGDGLSAGISISDSILRLTFNGQFIGDNKASSDLWSQADFETKKYGGQSDKWGLSGTAFSAYLFKQSGFGLSISPHIVWSGLSPGALIQSDDPPFIYGPQGGVASNARIDQIKLTFFYETPSQQFIDPSPVESTENLSLHTLAFTGQYYVSDYLIAKNIANKQIPDNYQIQGLEVRIRRKGSDSTSGHNLFVYDENVKLYSNGNIIGDNKAKQATLWPDINTAGFETTSYGSSNDLWGLTNVTGSLINDDDFGVAINVRFKYDDENDVDNINIDFIDLNVTYILPSTPQEISPNPIDSAEDFDNPTILRTNARFLNQIFSPAYEVGYFDVMALARDINIDPHYDLSYSTLNTNYLFTANNITLNYKQESNLGKRLAGEGANPNTFKVDTRTYDLSFNIPIRIESWGYIDTVFSALYDFMIQGYKGSSTIYMGRILSSNNNPLVNVSSLQVDNIVDFLNLSTPFTAYIRSDDDEEDGETVTVTTVNKTTKTLTLSGQTSKPHTPNISYIWAKPTNPTTNREPSFNIFSLREGLFTGCVVNSIKISITPGQTLNAQINIKFTNLDRKYQSNIFSNLETILTNVNDRKPNFLINGSQVSIENSRIESSEFTLGDIKNSPLFRGYQESLIRDFEVNSFEINFDNNLQAVYSLNAKSNSFDKNFIKNLQPYAYYSNGRNISGSIKYSSPLKPWLFAEKLAGPPSLNKQDLIVNFGPFKLTLPEIVWSPDSSESSVEEVHKKSVSFTVATEKLTYDPYFEPTGIL